MPDVFTIVKPENPLPLVFDSPHSGSVYPEDFGFSCPFDLLRRTEDTHVDTLFSGAPAHGGTLLAANFPRAYIDANRAADDIDPLLLDGPWPFGDINPTSRSDAGIGLIRRIVTPGAPVYDRRLSAREISARIEHYYTPYHDALKRELDEACYRFGQVWHINCHSMPASAATPRHAIGWGGAKIKPSDFVLSDRDGATCDPDFVRALRDVLKNLGYAVTINDPFKGAELITRHARPTRGRHSLQIEINKSLYMNEVTGEKTGDFNALQGDIDRLIAFCASWTKAQLRDIAAD